MLGGKLYAVAPKVTLLYRCWRRGEGEGSVHVFDAIGDGRGLEANPFDVDRPEQRAFGVLNGMGLIQNHHTDLVVEDDLELVFAEPS